MFLSIFFIVTPTFLIMNIMIVKKYCIWEKMAITIYVLFIHGCRSVLVIQPQQGLCSVVQECRYMEV